MKAKITYLLINAAYGSLMHQPHAVSGASGKLYGHALYSKEHGTHVFEIDQETYESKPGKPGADLDIAKNAHRPLQKWVVRAKVGVEFDEQETGMAAEIDRLNAEIANVKRAAESLAGDLITAERMIEKLSNRPQAAPVKVVNEGSSNPPPVPATPAVPSEDLTRETQHLAAYADLKALAKERGIDLGHNPKRAALIEALWPLEPAAV